MLQISTLPAHLPALLRQAVTTPQDPLPLLIHELSLHAYQMSVVGPGRVTQLIRASSQYAKVVGLILTQGTHKNQPMNA